MLHIGVLQFTLEIPYAGSLKDKRSVIKGLRERLRRNYNISIAEIDDLEPGDRAGLGVVAVAAGEEEEREGEGAHRLLEAGVVHRSDHP